MPSNYRAKYKYSKQSVGSLHLISCLISYEQYHFMFFLLFYFSVLLSLKISILMDKIFEAFHGSFCYYSFPIHIDKTIHL